MFAVLLGVLLGLQALFTLGIVLGAAVPDGPVVRAIAREIEPDRSWGFPVSDGVGGRGVPSTDQAILTSGLGQPELNAWERAVVMPRLSTGTPGYEQVMRLAEGGDLDEELRGYFRYWAGYTVLTRPVLAVWGIPGMRLLAGVLLSVGAWMAAREVARRASARHVLALGLPLLAGTNILVTPSVSIAHALSFAVTFAGLALLARADAAGLRAVLVASVAAASVYSFMDLLTNPVIPWALSAALAASLAYRRTDDVRSLVVHGLSVAVVWPLAWAVTWMSRWALAVLGLGRERAWADITGQVEARMDLEAAGVDGTFGAATWRNARYWWDHLPTAPSLVAVTAVVLVLVAGVLARRARTQILPMLLLCSPALLVPVWYEVFSNHSQIQDYFTYRYLPLALSVLLLAAATVWEQRPREQPMRPTSEEPAGSGSGAAYSRSGRPRPR